MSGYLRSQDVSVWLAAKPYLDVRNNDEHTLISYRIAQALLRETPEADVDVVLPGIILHDVGWKRVPEDKLTRAVGPKPEFPELVPLHEVEGVAIARTELTKLKYGESQIDKIVAVIDGHDTTKNKRSAEDAVLKDADKLWRFSPHGVEKLCLWFSNTPMEINAILRNMVMPLLLTPTGRVMGETLLATAEANATLDELMALRGHAK